MIGRAVVRLPTGDRAVGAHQEVQLEGVVADDLHRGPLAFEETPEHMLGLQKDGLEEFSLGHHPHERVRRGEYSIGT